VTFVKNGITFVRTGSGAYVSANTVQWTHGGATPQGGTVTANVMATVSADATGTYVTDYSGSATGFVDNSHLGLPFPAGPGYTCTFTSTGNATKLTSDVTVIVDPALVPGNVVTSNAQTLATSVTTTTGFLGARVQGALSGSRHTGVSRAGRGYMISGLSSGDAFNNLGVWASYAHTEFDNDFSRTKYDGDTNSFLVGADFTPRDNMVLGLAVGYENTDTDTDFNGGQSDADGYTIAPYFGMTLNDTWNIDAMAGYSTVDTDQYRRALVGGAPVGARITSDVLTQRWFFAGNINGFTSIDQWRLSGRAGAMFAKGTDEKFTESGGGTTITIAERMSEISQLSLGGEAAYAFDEFEPFVSATYNYDMTKTETEFLTGKQPSSDDDDFLLGFGFRYFGESGLSVSAQYDTRVGRSDYDEDTFSINARWDF